MIDYMVMEAVCLRVAREDEAMRKKAEKEAEIKEWKKQGREDPAIKSGLTFEQL